MNYADTSTNKMLTYTLTINTKLKSWFRDLLCHPARKRIGLLYSPRETMKSTNLSRDKLVCNVQLVEVIQLPDYILILQE